MGRFAWAAVLLLLAGPARAQPDRGLAEVRRLEQSMRPAAAVAVLLVRLDEEAARRDAAPGLTGPIHEALVVLTAHDPMPSHALDDDVAWAAPHARQELALAWHALLDPAAARPFGELRRAGLTAAREAFWSSDATEQFSLIRRLARVRVLTDRAMARRGLIELWDLGTQDTPLERARAFARRHHLQATAADIREHCRVHCCV